MTPVFVPMTGARQDGAGMDPDKLRGDAVQVDRNVHHQDRRGSVAAARRPHCDDAEYVVQSVQETVRRPHRQVGDSAAYHPGQPIGIIIIIINLYSVPVGI